MRDTFRLAAALSLALPAAPGAAQVSVWGPECFDMQATIVGTEGDDVLMGTSGDDVIAGLEGDDVIGGLRGGDALCGGAGDDEIAGGRGNDGIVVGRGADVGGGGPGFDMILEFSSDACGPCSPVDPRSRDDSVDHISGGPDSDLVSGEGGDDVIDGGDGNDLAFHVSRFTSMTVDLGLGTAISSAGDVDSLESIEAVFGSVNSDIIRGDAGRNWLSGGMGRDFIDGADGSDFLFTGFWGSTLVGGSDESADTIRVGILEPSVVDLRAGVAYSRETAHLHPVETIVGFEDVVGGAYDDVVTGDAGPNVLEGGYGHDEVDGAGGNDYIFGDDARRATLHWVGTAPGNDVLDGGIGDDRLDGGPLVDECTNGEDYTSCEDRDGSERSISVAPPAGLPSLPWWWARLDIDYLHESAFEGLLRSLPYEPWPPRRGASRHRNLSPPVFPSRISPAR